MTTRIEIENMGNVSISREVGDLKQRDLGPYFIYRGELHVLTGHYYNDSCCDSFNITRGGRAPIYAQTQVVPVKEISIGYRL